MRNIGASLALGCRSSPIVFGVLRTAFSTLPGVRSRIYCRITSESAVGEPLEPPRRCRVGKHGIAAPPTEFRGVVARGARLGIRARGRLMGRADRLIGQFIGRSRNDPDRA